MNLPTTARVAGLLGGLLWIVRVVLDRAGLSSELDALHWSGLVLLAVALAAVGAGLVSKSATWLRIVVAVAVPLLVWSVVEVVRPVGDALAFDGVLGAIVVLAALGSLLRRRPRKDAPGTPRPSRAARAARGRATGSHAR